MEGVGLVGLGGAPSGFSPSYSQKVVWGEGVAANPMQSCAFNRRTGEITRRAPVIRQCGMRLGGGGAPSVYRRAQAVCGVGAQAPRTRW